ncbi:hypothetical protein J2Z42_002420 [Clostridium algifaecis]|uniref:DUF2953 domain-containing protein n=1 Tax=Clostridium algifaecis TaxID=1472040 RepID=A0ABS4KUJ2_9CLOT|nr:hypothetical protein [Clostridium algifaecis]
MFILLAILIILFILLFVPIPIKLHFKYNNKKLQLYIFNIDIVHKFKNQKKRKKKSAKKNIDSAKHIKKVKFILKSIKNIGFKIPINIKLNMSYGLNDAAYTAILYGIINSIIQSLFILLSKVFIFKKCKVNLSPYFNKNFFKIEITSIIYISFAKIMYIVLLLAIKKIKLKQIT